MNPYSFDVANLRDKNYYSLLVDLINFIRSKHYKVGDKLPQESILATELSSNRSTLREMLRVLEVLGVIDSKRGSGNIYLGNLDIGFMNLFIVASMLSDQAPLEFNSIRATIEASAVDLFIDKATDVDIYKLKMLYNDHMSENVDKASMDYLDAHIRFHELLLKYYGNETAKQLTRSSLRLMKRDYETSVESDTSISPETREYYKMKQSSSSHLMIIKAIEARDKALAKELVIKHALMATKQNNSI